MVVTEGIKDGRTRLEFKAKSDWILTISTYMSLKIPDVPKNVNIVSIMVSFEKIIVNLVNLVGTDPNLQEEQAG